MLRGLQDASPRVFEEKTGRGIPPENYILIDSIFTVSFSTVPVMVTLCPRWLITFSLDASSILMILLSAVTSTGADPPFTHRSTQATDFSDASACFAAHIESTMVPFSSAADRLIEAITT